ncbi:MAG: F0F1 ATP synthase subunit B [Planctomycetaceae bacterium]
MGRSFSSWLLILGCCLAVGLCLSVGRAGADEVGAAGAQGDLPAEAGSDHHSAELSEGEVATGEHAENGPPMSFTADLALWSLIVFVLFLFILKKFAWLPMIEGLDKRESGIRKAIADAEDGRRKSQALLAEYEQKLKIAEQTVQAMVAEARRDAERTGQDLIANAQREVEAVRDRAKEDIRQARDTALSEVFTQMNSQIVRATEQVLGRALQDIDQDRLIGEALAEVSR